MDRATVNRLVQMSFHFLIVYLGYIPGREIAESKDKCMLTLLLDIAKFFAVEVVPFYNYTNSAQGFHFSTSSPILIIFWLGDYTIGQYFRDHF